jgi:hypothetical protein
MTTRETFFSPCRCRLIHRQTHWLRDGGTAASMRSSLDTSKTTNPHCPRPRILNHFSSILTIRDFNRSPTTWDTVRHKSSANANNRRKIVDLWTPY